MNSIPLRPEPSKQCAYASTDQQRSVRSPAPTIANTAHHTKPNQSRRGWVGRLRCRSSPTPRQDTRDNAEIYLAVAAAMLTPAAAYTQCRQGPSVRVHRRDMQHELFGFNDMGPALPLLRTQTQAPGCWGVVPLVAPTCCCCCCQHMTHAHSKFAAVGAHTPARPHTHSSLLYSTCRMHTRTLAHCQSAVREITVHTHTCNVPPSSIHHMYTTALPAQAAPTPRTEKPPHKGRQW